MRISVEHTRDLCSRLAAEAGRIAGTGPLTNRQLGWLLGTPVDRALRYVIHLKERGAAEAAAALLLHLEGLGIPDALSCQAAAIATGPRSQIPVEDPPRRPRAALHALRDRQGWTVEDVAALLGCSEARANNLRFAPTLLMSARTSRIVEIAEWALSGPGGQTNLDDAIERLRHSRGGDGGRDCRRVWSLGAHGSATAS